MNTHLRIWLLWMGLCGLLLAALHGCGGGSVAGVGSGGSGTASGTVSGFGSVVVDGVEYSDSNATVRRPGPDGTLANADLQLGQRVQLVLGSSSVAQSITVVSQLVGSVGSVPDSNGWMQVLGQWVRLVTSNNDSTRCSPTVLGGYSALGSIGSGDAVEVYGSWVWDNSKAATVLVATRLQKLSAAPAVVQLGGVVYGLSGTQFHLNSATGTLVQASALPTGLANGQVVQVWTANASAAPVPASRVVLAGVLAQDLGSEQTLTLGGLASQYNASTRTVVVQGTTVQLADEVVVDTAALAAGQFVSLQVQRVGNTLVASTVSLRSGSGPNDDQGGISLLLGVTSGVDWSASSVRFQLRGVDVVAAAAVIDNHCRAAPLTADVSVRVQGQVQAPGQAVTATQVQCSQTVGSDAVLQREGTVLSVQTSANSLVLRTSRGDVNATWDSSTYFAQSPTTLAGVPVEVEGVLNGSTLRLRTVRLEH